MLTRCSADLRYRFASAAYTEMLGCSADEINGKSIVDVMGEEGFATVLPHIQKVLKGETVEYKTEIAFRDVGIRYLHVIYTPETNAQGEVIGWIASIRDRREQAHRTFTGPEPAARAGTVSVRRSIASC